MKQTTVPQLPSPPDRYLEDFRVGEIWTSAPVHVGAQDIKDFGLQYDPQPFHIDEASAKSGPFGGLVASGWHIAALAMRAYVLEQPLGKTPILGMGIDELRWLRPVRPDSQLSFRREILSVEPSASRPDRGVLRTLLTAADQHGRIVMKLITLSQVPARGKPMDSTR